jgi:hypothetical protein
MPTQLIISINYRLKSAILIQTVPTTITGSYPRPNEKFGLSARFCGLHLLFAFDNTERLMIMIAIIAIALLQEGFIYRHVFDYSPHPSRSTAPKAATAGWQA